MNARISPARAERIFALQIIAGVIAFKLLRVVCTHFLSSTPEDALRVALALLPALPVLWMLWSLHRYLSRADELQRRVHMEALGIAAGVTAALSISYAMLEESAGFPHLPARWVFLVVGLTWVLSGVVLWRRYK